MALENEKMLDFQALFTSITISLDTIYLNKPLVVNDRQEKKKTKKCSLKIVDNFKSNSTFDSNRFIVFVFVFKCKTFLSGISTLRQNTYGRVKRNNFFFHFFSPFPLVFTLLPLYFYYYFLFHLLFRL